MLRNNGRHNFRSPFGIQPSLVLDFAGTGTLDPRVTFTRSTSAYYYNGSTQVLAEQNLFIYSNTFTDASWVKTGGTVASGVTDPAGGTTAFSFTATALNATLYQTVTLTATPYVVSIWIQRASGVGLIRLTLDGVTLNPVTITGSWAKYSYTATPSAGAKTVGIQVATIGDVINIYGSQLENRSVSTSTNITTSAILQNYIPQLLNAAIDVPRFNFNPVTSVALGLMREPSSTNVLFYSQDIGAVGYWSKANLAPTLNAATIAPDGNQTAQKLIPDSTLGIHRAFQSGLSYKTGSIYVKQSDSFYPYAYLGYYDGANYNGVIINLSNGALVQNVNSPTSYVVTSVGNGWFKISLTYSGTSAYFTFSPVPASYTISGGMPSYTGNSYSGCYVWQAQAEALSFSTSPIVTTFSQVTRAADIASITGTNFSSWFTQGQGTLYEEITLNTTLLLPSLPNFYDSATPTTNNIDIWYGSSANFASAGTKVAGVSYPTSTISVPFTPPATGKFAFSFATNQGYFSVDGSSPTNISSLSIPTVDTFSLFGGANTSLYSGGSIYIKKISYYPQALTSAQLQALTGS